MAPIRARAAAVWRALTGRESAVPRGRSYYAAAQSTRLTDDWFSTLLDPADETKVSAAKLRGRARDLRRNNPLVARIADLAVDNIVGPDGITLQATPGNSRGAINEALRGQCEAIWYEWGERAGLNGASWDSLSRLLVESRRIEGEALLEIVYDDSLPLGIAVQVLDPDLLDAGYDVYAQDGTLKVTQGVQVSRMGAVEGYWLWKKHPAAPGPNERRFVPADRLCFDAHRPRPGMVRGITPLAPVMLRLQMLNGTQEALVMLHRAAANKGGFFTQKGEGDPLADDVGGPVQFDAAPLSIETLPVGMEFTPWDPGQPTQQYDPFQKSLKAEIAVGSGVSYVSLTGDLSETSFSSGKIGLQSERDRWRVAQREHAAAFCQPVYAAVLRQARIRGRLQRPEGLAPDRLASAEWHGRRWEHIDAQKEVPAILEAIQGGLTTLTRELNRSGLDIREVLAERAAELALAKSLGVPLGEPAPAGPPPPDDASQDDERRPPLKVAK